MMDGSWVGNRYGEDLRFLVLDNIYRTRRQYVGYSNLGLFKNY